jgi:hypothetical protein
MNIESICKPRFIGNLRIETPLVVPSFSSIANKKIGEIYQMLRDHIPEASLVSAYDLNYGVIDRKDIWVSDIVFLDSGNYERERLKILQKKREEWSLKIYEKLIQSLIPLSSLVLVNFDERKPVTKQIEEAQDLFSNYQDVAKCFLYRPPSRSADFIDVDNLTRNLSSLLSFDVLGIAEKELGPSPLARCKNILRIRVALKSQDLDIPIHVFGCLDPIGVILYFLSGADVFDGTLWLRFSFYNDIAIYANNAAILSGSWSLSDNDFLGATYVLNLKKLTHLLYNLRRFSRKHDPSVLGLNSDLLRVVKDIISDAGLNWV